MSSAVSSRPSAKSDAVMLEPRDQVADAVRALEQDRNAREPGLEPRLNGLLAVEAEHVVRHVGINSRPATDSISAAGSNQTP